MDKSISNLPKRSTKHIANHRSYESLKRIKKCRLSYIIQAAPRTIFDSQELRDQIRKILTTPNEDRSVSDTKQLCDIFQKGDFFKQIQPNNYMQGLVNMITLEKYKAKSIIFKEGDVGDAFYIILTGQIDGFLEIKEKNFDELIGLTPENSKIDKQKQSNVGREYVFTLFKGEAFGEFALQSTNTRSHTCVASEDTELIKVSQKSFMALVNHHKVGIYKDIITLLDDCQLFRGITQDIKYKLIEKCNVEKYPANCVIIKQNEFPMYIYIIKKGGIKILRKIKKKKVENWQNLRNIYTEEFDSLADEIIMEIEELTDKSFICDYELVHQLCMRNTVLTTQPAELIRISIYDLMDILSPNNIKTIGSNCKVFPTDREVMDHFLKNNHWKQFKMMLVQDFKFQKKCQTINNGNFCRNTFKAPKRNYKSLLKNIINPKERIKVGNLNQNIFLKKTKSQKKFLIGEDIKKLVAGDFELNTQNSEESIKNMDLDIEGLKSEFRNDIGKEYNTDLNHTVTDLDSHLEGDENIEKDAKQQSTEFSYIAYQNDDRQQNLSNNKKSQYCPVEFNQIQHESKLEVVYNNEDNPEYPEDPEYPLNHNPDQAFGNLPLLKKKLEFSKYDQEDNSFIIDPRKIDSTRRSIQLRKSTLQAKGELRESGILNWEVLKSKRKQSVADYHISLLKRHSIHNSAIDIFSTRMSDSGKTNINELPEIDKNRKCTDIFNSQSHQTRNLKKKNSIFCNKNKDSEKQDNDRVQNSNSNITITDDNCQINIFKPSSEKTNKKQYQLSSSGLMDLGQQNLKEESDEQLQPIEYTAKQKAYLLSTNRALFIEQLSKDNAENDKQVSSIKPDKINFQKQQLLALNKSNTSRHETKGISKMSMKYMQSSRENNVIKAANQQLSRPKGLAQTSQNIDKLFNSKRKSTLETSPNNNVGKEDKNPLITQRIPSLSPIPAYHIQKGYKKNDPFTDNKPSLSGRPARNSFSNLMNPELLINKKSTRFKDGDYKAQAIYENNQNHTISNRKFNDTHSQTIGIDSKNSINGRLSKHGKNKRMSNTVCEDPLQSQKSNSNFQDGFDLKNSRCDIIDNDDHHKKNKFGERMKTSPKKEIKKKNSRQLKTIAKESPQLQGFYSNEKNESRCSFKS